MSKKLDLNALSKEFSKKTPKKSKSKPIPITDYIHAGWKITREDLFGLDTFPEELKNIIKEFVEKEYIVAHVHVGKHYNSKTILSWYKTKENKELIGYIRGYYYLKNKKNTNLILDIIIEGTPHYLNIIDTTNSPFYVKKGIKSGRFGQLNKFTEKLHINVTSYIKKGSINYYDRYYNHYY
jgi:hypothetical protein